MQFREFLANTRLNAKLPFDIDTELTKGNWEGYPTEQIGSLSIPRLDDLTHAETFLFEAIGGLNENKLIEMRSEMLQLASSLQAKFPEVSVLDCYSLIFTPTEFLSTSSKREDEIKELLADKSIRGNERIKLEEEAKKLALYPTILSSEAYSDWLILSTESLTKITTLSQSRESDINVDWVQVTFFLMSRLGDWDMNRTGSLTRKTITAIKAFMAKEANNGITPEPEPVADTEEATDVKS